MATAIDTGHVFTLCVGVAVGFVAAGACATPPTPPVAIAPTPDASPDAAPEASADDARAEAMATCEPPEERACELGKMEACMTLAMRLHSGVGAPKDDARAAALNEKACSAGLVLACESLAFAYRDGQGVAKDEARSARLFEKVCDAASGDAAADFHSRSCVGFADALLDGRGVAKDEARAARLYDKACEAGAFEVCFTLAKLVARGRGTPKNPARAADLLMRACGNAFGVGCDEAAAMFRAGDGVARDLVLAKAMESYAVGWAASACDMHAVVSECERVARYYARGYPPADAQTAMSRIETACARGVADACRLAARRYPPAQAAKALARARDLADPARTKAMLERECDAGVLGDCYLLGDAYLYGNAKWKIAKDVERGRALVLKSCNGDSLTAECRAAAGFDDRSARDAGAPVPCAP